MGKHLADCYLLIGQEFEKISTFIVEKSAKFLMKIFETACSAKGLSKPA